MKRALYWTVATVVAAALQAVAAADTSLPTIHLQARCRTSENAMLEITNVLRAAKLPNMKNNMTLLRSVKLRCKNCGLRGTGKKQFMLSIPLDDDEAEAFLQGRNIKGRRASM